MDHTRPRHVRRDPDQPDTQSDDPEPEGPAAVRAHILDQLYAQWRDGVPKGRHAILLQHTVLEDPESAPYLTLLAGDGADDPDLVRLWDETQRAADATVLGRLYRPLVTLAPVRGRWTVVRAALGNSAREPLSYADPRAALQAARARFGEILRRGGMSTDTEAILSFLPALTEQPDDYETEAPDADGAADDQGEVRS